MCCQVVVSRAEASHFLGLGPNPLSKETTSVSRCAVIYLFSVDMPTPRSSTTYLRVSPHWLVLYAPHLGETRPSVSIP